MTNTLKMAVLATSMAASLAIAPLSFAQTPTLRPVNQLKCDKTATRIDALVIKAEARSKQITETDTKVQDWWNNIGKTAFVSRYGQTNYDTLNGYFATLHTQYGMPLATDAQKYAADLQSLDTMSKNGDCGTSNGDFVLQLKTVKTDRDTLHADITNWRNYFNNTIREFVQGLKGTTPTITPAQ